MPEIFSVAAVCLPDIHYMVDISDRLCAIKKMVDRGDYFTINRARQYGKTTTMYAWVVTWEEDCVEVVLSGSEQYDEQVVLQFDGSASAETLNTRYGKILNP